ncbi:hypothetical protein PPERSA_05637 [Pseudocohnilembus persalinus]|uniref:Uncharacterized protein n=1 Tax=Pseudocohnilembus persalinus TaxID=266149 RepID=A0A0V0QQT5_PSEPJ|nr:hypothetical protein PPERSA_05637 [Pseudocohnilembus persalinus]|eukprot:KRX04376.1 hypothetical protein PPERSA_05637 [Pseudocohnilembus persalinus]
MEKDYKGSKIYTEEQLNIYNVPYIYRDYCTDDYMNYLICARQSSKALENNLVYSLPFSNSFTKCGIYQNQWKQCQDYREREIYEEMRKLYLKGLKDSRLGL